VLTDGVRYVYRGTFEAEVGSDHVVGKASTRFTWDSTISATRIRLDTRDTYRPEIIRDVGVFYPERDPRSFGKWRDQVAVVVPQESGTEAIKIDELTITNTAGDVVRRITDPLGVASWNGRRANRDLVPKGLYTVEAAVSDPAGNASLKSPARAAWRGSIGLRSRATGPRCRELRAQTASTVFGITLPRTPLGDPDLYTHVRVATYGGGARPARATPTWSTGTGRGARSGSRGRSSPSACGGTRASGSVRTSCTETLTRRTPRSTGRSA
jgi:hypothetical protein